ncbi:MAG TPA: MlaD family protein [Usitatibacter sp.]|nr:MlaD family protein [Usitatibacter sp.]
MSDEQPRIPHHDELPVAVPRKPGPRLLQPIWIVPIVALLVGGWMAVKAFMNEGPTITIQFKSAEGIEPGKTRIKHKAVDVGTVKSVSLSQDFKNVVVTAEMDRQAAGFLVEDTRFWVVRPRIAGGQVSGLGTLLAGSYIGADPGASKNEKRSFVGLEVPPAITSDLQGRQFTLRADDLGSLDVSSPVYFRGVMAGRVVSADVSPEGDRVMVGIFVHSPFDRFVSADTRFWNASGVDLSLDATGVKLQTQSLITLLLGGIAFETPPREGGNNAAAPAPAAEKTQFALWSNRNDAMRIRERVVEQFALVFEQSVRGLAVGAPVDFRGITVGEVKRIELEFDRERVNYRTVVLIDFYPERLRSRNRSSDPASRWNQLNPVERMQRFVEHGFRAQLRNGNLLTGQMYVALDFFPKAPRAKLDTTKKPPAIPTMSSGLAELQESITNIVAKLEKVPFDAIAQDLRKTLQGMEATLKRADSLVAKLDAEVAPALRGTLEDARKTLRSVDQAVSSDSPLQGDLRGTLMEVTRTAEQLRELVDYLERHPESLIRGRRSGGDRK